VAGLQVEFLNSRGSLIAHPSQAILIAVLMHFILHVLFVNTFLWRVYLQNKPNWWYYTNVIYLNLFSMMRILNKWIQETQLNSRFVFYSLSVFQASISDCYSLVKFGNIGMFVRFPFSATSLNRMFIKCLVVLKWLCLQIFICSYVLLKSIVYLVNILF
jgi:hypothetical protein